MKLRKSIKQAADNREISGKQDTTKLAYTGNKQLRIR